MEQHTITPPNVDREVLREAIQAEYRVVASEPDKGLHFHTGRKLTEFVSFSGAYKVMSKVRSENAVLNGIEWRISPIM